MHLNRTQTERLFRLLDSLIIFTNEQLNITDESFDISEEHNPDVESVVAEIMTHMWKDPSLIKDFIRANPFDLSKQDLQTIEEWGAYHITDSFIVTEHTPLFSVFSTTEYAFGVIGINQNIGSLVIPSLPKMVHTTLLPFEGRIIYDTTLLLSAFEGSPSILELFDESSRNTRHKHGILTTSQDLIRVSPTIQESNKQRMQDFLSDQQLRESGGGMPDELPGVHRGALSGLSEEERQKAIDERYASFLIDMGVSIVDILKKEAFTHAPVFSLLETFCCYNKDALVSIARQSGFTGYSKLKKQELAELLTHNVREDSVEFLEGILKRASPDTRTFIDGLVKQGGTLRIDSSELNSMTINDIEYATEPIPPLLNLFHEKGVYTYVIPKEFLSSYGLLDKAAIEQAAQQSELFFKSANFFTQVYGLISIFELKSWMESNGDFPYLDEEDFLTSVMVAVLNESFDFGLFIPENHADIYLTHYELSDVYISAADASEEALDDFFRFRDYIMDRHEEIERKDFTLDEILGPDPYERYLTLPETRELQAILDAYVPDEEDDYTFADDVLQEVYDIVQYTSELKHIASFFIEFGLPFELVSSQDFLDTLIHLVNKMPLWENNGWSASELFERQHGKKAPSYGRLKVIEGGLAKNKPSEPQERQKISRNEPCPCKSGKKYKNCCGAPNKPE